MAPVAMPNNATISILEKARAGRYGVISMVVYDWGMANALVQAAEAKRSPIIIQVFPPTMRQQGGAPFLRGLLELARRATVPVSIHVDHAQKAEDITYLLDMAEEGTPLDSIMIDCSHADTLDENIATTKGFVARAVKLGLATEAELGRLEGGEAGIATAADSQLTDPDVAERFIEETGVQILAPCIGNRHGRYVQAPDFKMDILAKLQERVSTYICMHGTDDLSDELFRDLVKAGSVKINLNSWLRDPYLEAVKDGLTQDLPLPEVIDRANQAFIQSAYRFMALLGSEGKA